MAEDNRVKTIFITSFHGLVSRVLESGVLDLLLHGGARVILLVPDFKKDYFVRTFHGKNNLIIEGVSRLILNKRTFVFHKLAFMLLNTRTMYLTRRSFRGYKRVYEFVLAQLLATCIGRFRVMRNLFRAINYHFSGKDVFTSCFEKYKPHLVFSTDIKEILDSQLIIEAQKKGIDTIGMVRSWDYITGKGLVRVKPDTLVVHNTVLKDEAIQHIDMEEEDIFVSGIPHFDPYINVKRSHRENFFKRLNLDVSKRLLLYVPWGDKFVNTDWQFLAILEEAIESGVLPKDLHVVMRVPPGDSVTLDKLVSQKHLTVDVPGITFGVLKRKANEMSFDDLLHLADTLYYSSVVVTPPSTMVIDAAAFDKPIVLMGFDGFQEKKYYEGIRHYYDFNHVVKLVHIAQAPFARNQEELIRFVNDCLKDPTIGREGRKRTIETQCYKLDGKSSKRLADFVLSKLS